MTEDPWNTPWGNKPYPAVTFAHAVFWFAALSALVKLGFGCFGWFLAFESLGLFFYSRWLLCQIPYEEGPGSDTMRSA